jgi:hypothetical protein
MNWKKILSVSLLLAAGGVVGYFIGSLLSNGGDEAESYALWQKIVLLVSLPVFYLLVVGWHELGHVLAGLLMRFKFMSLTIGPFAWRRYHDQVRFTWNRNVNLSGGLAYMLPQGEENMARRFATFAAGGPLASLVLAVLGLGLSFPLASGSMAELLAGVVGVFSLVIFALTIAPFRAGGFSSDGRRILTLLGKSEAARHEVTLLRVIAFTQSERQLTDLPIDAIDAGVASAALTPQYRAFFEYYRYLYYLSTGDLDTAEEALTAFTDGLDTFPPGLRESYYIEPTLFYCFEREQLAKAAAAYAQFKATTFTQEIEVELAEAGLDRLRGMDTVGRAAAIETKLDEVQERAKLRLYRRWLDKLCLPYTGEEEE